MFYEEKFDDALRFGDVLTGFALASSTVKEPNRLEKLDINIDIPKYSVIITPCCSIGEKMISLSPLIEVKGSYFDNPYLADDLTRINRTMKPEQTVAPNVWNTFPSEQKQKRLAEGEAYAFLYIFVYENHDLLPKYQIKRRNGIIETNYYMIDFRNICKVNCEKIIDAKRSPLDVKMPAIICPIKIRIAGKDQQLLRKARRRG